MAKSLLGIGNLMKSMDPDELAGLGQQMLDSGQVTPEEVQAAQMASDDPEGGKEWLSKFMRDTKPGERFTVGKGKQKKDSTNAKRETNDTVKKDLFQNAEQFAARASDFEGLPFMQDQKRGIDDADAMLSMEMSQPRAEDSDYWIRPLLNLTDSQTGSKLSQGYKAPESNAERMTRLLKARGDIDERKAGYSKQLLEGLTKMKEGTETNALTQQLAQQMGFTQGMLSSGGGSRSGLTPYEEAVDKKAGAGMGEMLQKGGFSGVDGNLQIIDETLRKLEGYVDETGKKHAGLKTGIGTGVASAMGLGEALTPEAASVEQAMKQVSVSGLKSLLPGAISDYESRMISELAYNPKLGSKYNIEKLKRAKAALEKGRRNSKIIMDFTKKWGSLKGFDPDTMLDNTPITTNTAPKKTAAAPGVASADGDDLNADLSKMDAVQLKAWLAKHGG